MARCMAYMRIEAARATGDVDGVGRASCSRQQRRADLLQRNTTREMLAASRNNVYKVNSSLWH